MANLLKEPSFIIVYVEGKTTSTFDFGLGATLPFCPLENMRLVMSVLDAASVSGHADIPAVGQRATVDIFSTPKRHIISYTIPKAAL